MRPVAFFFCLCTALLFIHATEAFITASTFSLPRATSSSRLQSQKQRQQIKDDDGQEKNSGDAAATAGGGGGGFMSNFMKNVDQQIDDFFNKRMGNGEVFYGKRKYNPSGKVDGEYNGMGLTDKTRINIARARKAQFLAEREEKQRAEMKRRGLL